jgi:5-methylcytosine-specific restriction endonuclease McrA
VTADTATAADLAALSATSTEASLLRRCRAALAEHRRRARRDHQGALSYGLADLEALARAAPRCAYCGALLDAATFTFDHARPLARVADYSLANLVVCCRLCNEQKGLLTGAEFRQLLALLRTWHPRAGADLLARLRAGGRRYGRGRRTPPCG